MPRRFDRHIWRPDKAGQRLYPDVVVENGVLGPRSNFANDRRRIADFRGVIERLVKKLEVPVVEIGAGAVGGFGRTGISEYEVANKRSNLLFPRIQLRLQRRAQIFPAGDV